MKPIAQLYAGLLARKGEGKPAHPAAPDEIEIPAPRPGTDRSLRRREPMAGRVCVTVRLDPPSHRLLKDEAAREGRSLCDVVSAALATFIDREARKIKGMNCACLTAPLSTSVELKGD